MTTLSSGHPLYKPIMEIQDTGTPAVFTIEFTFINPNNEKLAITVDHLDRLDILGDYSRSFMDYLEADLRLNVVDYRNLMNNYNDLRSVVSFYLYDEEKKAKGKLYMTEVYQVLLHNLKDLSSALPQSEMYDEKDPDKDMTALKRGQYVNIKVQFIKKDVYQLSKLRMSGTLDGADISKALWLFCEALKINKFCLYPPDNKRVYEHIELPALQGLDTIFGYLQKTYGIYDHDGNLYYHNGILYCYPLLVTEGKSEDTFHIYKAPVGLLFGSKSTTLFKGNDTMIFINQITDHQVSAAKDVERANSIFTVNSGDIIDNWGTHDENGTTTSKDKASVYNASVGKGSVTNTHTPVWAPNYDNECMIKSQLARLNVSTLITSWSSAYPFIIKPFQKIMFHYDKNGKMESLPCTCPSVAYTFDKQGRADQALFTVQASLKLFLPNGVDVF